MRAGSLRHRVTFEAPVDVKSASGSVSQTWAVFAENVPVAIDPLSSREFFAAAQVQSEVSNRISMRWMRGIHERMRIRHEVTDVSPPEVEYFYIDGAPVVDPTGRRSITLYVTRRSTEGFRK